MWIFFFFLNKAIVLWQTAKAATGGALHLCGLPLRFQLHANVDS